MITRDRKLAEAWAKLGARVTLRADRYGAPVYLIGKPYRKPRAVSVARSNAKPAPVAPITEPPTVHGVNKLSVARAMATVNTWTR